MPGSLIQGNAIQIPLKDKSVQLVCFSPPYWKLRKYKVNSTEFPNGWKGQMGLEPTLDQYLDNLMLAMAEVWRVLRDDGCVFVNIGDSFWNASGSCHNRGYGKNAIRAGRKDAVPLPLHRGNKSDNPKIRPKSLCLVPQKFAIRCQGAGWIVRSEIIYAKKNPMPESVSDRPTRMHEQVWLMTKTGKYFWDKEAVKEKTRQNTKVGWVDSDLRKYSCDPRLEEQGSYKDWRKYCPTGIVDKRNIRTVWPLATEPTPVAHFATFPSKLVRTMILAGSSPRACEFCGAPWKRVVAKEKVTYSNNEEYAGKYVGKYHGEGGRSAGRRILDQMAALRAKGRDHDTPYLKTKTLGWRPTCKCKCAGTGRCVVLDPFVGTAVTVLEAEKNGRFGVGMDLSKEYLWDIALKKVRVPVQKMLELR